MLALADVDFNRLHTYIKVNYGIDLNKKRQLIVGRLSSTLASRGYRNFSEYMNEILTGRDKEMVTPMLNKLTTNYTYFLHEGAYLQFLQSTVLPGLAKKCAWDKILPTWGAGCSSREKPYIISMYPKEPFGSQANSWDIRALTTGTPQQILNKARSSVYREENLERPSFSWRQKYFVKNKDNTYIIAPVIKQNAIFQTLNLMNPIRFHRPFGSIFCRNVTIYFDRAIKDALIQCFYDTTMPGGYLLTGHPEDLNKATCPYEYLMPVIYQKIRR